MADLAWFYGGFYTSSEMEMPERRENASKYDLRSRRPRDDGASTDTDKAK